MDLTLMDLREAFTFEGCSLSKMNDFSFRFTHCGGNKTAITLEADSSLFNDVLAHTNAIGAIALYLEKVLHSAALINSGFRYYLNNANLENDGAELNLLSTHDNIARDAGYHPITVETSITNKKLILLSENAPNIYNGYNIPIKVTSITVGLDSISVRAEKYLTKDSELLIKSPIKIAYPKFATAKTFIDPSTGEITTEYGKGIETVFSIELTEQVKNIENYAFLLLDKYVKDLDGLTKEQ